MTFTEAAAEVLRLAGKPLHYKEITELAIEKNLLSHVGKSPEVTMGARLAALLKKEDDDNPIIRVKPGVFGLREWQDKKGRRKLEKEAEEAAAHAAASAGEPEAETEVNALEVEAATEAAREGDEEEGDETPIAEDESLRADLAASGAELFDDEEDDDQPILAPLTQGGQPQPSQPGEGGRRRRRRRRRGRGGGAQLEGGQYGVSGDRASQPRLEGSMQPMPALGMDGENGVDVGRDPLAPMPRPMVRDRQQIMQGGAPTGIDVPLPEGEELAGRDLADAAAILLSTFDRNAGPVHIRSVADALMRRGRLQGDPQAAVTQVSAALRADNLRRTASAQRMRFRFASGGRVALTDWALGGELPRLEAEVIAAVDRYREASRRALLRRLQELPGHVLIELALVALERAGMTQVRAVRRAGSPGGEAHFAAVHKAGGDEIRTALVMRKDGREIGRERVTDLRGALHHYGPASSGWLITTGQILSGAREEAAVIGAPPIALYDGISFCRLLEEHDVGVVRTRFPIAIPDLELLETLRGS
jgi:hypothetical protein